MLHRSPSATSCYVVPLVKANELSDPRTGGGAHIIFSYNFYFVVICYSIPKMPATQFKAILSSTTLANHDGIHLPVLQPISSRSSGATTLPPKHFQFVDNNDIFCGSLAYPGSESY